MSQQRMITPPLLTNEAQADLLRKCRMQNYVKALTQAEKKSIVEDLQNQVGALRESYSDDTLEFASLRLAWETLRIVWYAIDKQPLAVVEKMEPLVSASLEFDRVLFDLDEVKPITTAVIEEAMF